MGAFPVRQNTLHHWFSASVQRNPDAIALTVDQISLTYRELETAVESCALSMVDQSGRKPTRVGLVASRSLISYVGYLAAIRLGAAVVPLSLSVPTSRNVQMCTAAGVDALAPDREGSGPAAAISGATSIPIVDIAAACDASDRTTRDSVESAGPAANDVAYILFTSGSTGSPKGVPIRHSYLNEYLAFNISRYGVGPGCRLSQTFGLTFDPSVFDMFVAWGSGAALVVPSKQELLGPVSFVNDQGITHWFSVPSIASFAHRLGTLTEGVMPSLRWSMFAGEQFSLALSAQWAAAAPGSRIANLYGPTELTITCTSYELPHDLLAWPTTPNDTVPIGTVYPHLEHLILGSNGLPADEGELCVRGPQRFAGYLDPADNANSFVGTSPGTPAVPYEATDGGADGVDRDAWCRTGDRVRVEDGHIIHLGRLDSQIKLRGYRIEPGEIEVVLRRHPAIADVVVTPLRARDGELELGAVYTGVQTLDRELKKYVRRCLPAYMTPNQFLHLDSFPLNDNGKVDRARIAEGLTCSRIAVE